MSSSLGVICSECGKVDEQKVLDSRPALDAIRRRRICACGERFTTYEKKPTTTCFVVVHTVEEDGRVRTETFDVTPERGLTVVMRDDAVLTTRIRKPLIRKVTS